MTSVWVPFVLIFAVVQLSAAEYVVYVRLLTIDVSLSLNPNPLIITQLNFAVIKNNADWLILRITESFLDKYKRHKIYSLFFFIYQSFFDHIFVHNLQICIQIEFSKREKEKNESKPQSRMEKYA
jgi:hypothetical protein